MKTKYPERIICLTEETTELIYLLGAGDKIVGISGFTRRPPESRKTKPKVCTYIDANYEKIKKLNPDYIFAFSDMQAEIVKNLTLQGHHLVLFNQRSIKEILQNILVIGSIIDKKRESEKLVNKYEKRLEAISKKSGELKYRPKVYFEEWFEPMISGICWVSELIEIAGGDDIFPELRNKKNGKERIVTSEKVIKRNPDIIIGSWCGKQFKKNQVKKRGGWDKISAVKNKKLYEIKSSIILQPGPAALTEGLDKLVKLTHSY
jgi:iron complex transport system substrate-binding protein